MLLVGTLLDCASLKVEFVREKVSEIKIIHPINENEFQGGDYFSAQ